MMTLPSDRFVVSRTEYAATRKCPFCDEGVPDALEKDINFIVHLGSPTPKHQLTQAWADYVGFVNRI